MTDPNQPPSYPPPPNQPPPNQPPPPPAYGGAPSNYPQAAPYADPRSSSAAQPYDSYGSGGAPSGPVPGRTLGIVAMIGSIVLAGLSIVWLVLGIIALRQSKKAGRKNGFALAAIILSTIGIVLAVVAISVGIYYGVTVAQLCAEYGSGTYEVNGNPVEITCG